MACIQTSSQKIEKSVKKPTIRNERVLKIPPMVQWNIVATKQHSRAGYQTMPERQRKNVQSWEWQHFVYQQCDKVQKFSTTNVNMLNMTKKYKLNIKVCCCKKNNILYIYFWSCSIVNIRRCKFLFWVHRLSWRHKSKWAHNNRNPRWRSFWSDLEWPSCSDLEWHLNTKPLNISSSIM